ncbi:MAG: hypothetical protein KatS3mg129_2856 [Leptospiraceae bacterium]|nr:MAG: hypothetical protein KatS3mg129_2856 [Leptospiraceae bacterium]
MENLQLNLDSTQIRKIFKEIFKKYITENEQIENIIKDVLHKYLIEGQLPVSFTNPNKVDESIKEIFFKIKEQLEQSNEDTGKKKNKKSNDVDQKLIYIFNQLKNSVLYLKETILLNPNIESKYFDINKEINKKNLILEIPSIIINDYKFYGRFYGDFIIQKANNQFNKWKIYLLSNNYNNIELYLLFLQLKRIFNIQNLKIISFYFEKKWKLKEKIFPEQLINEEKFKNEFINFINKYIINNENRENNIKFYQYFEIDLKPDQENENQEMKDFMFISYEKQIIKEYDIDSDDELLSLCYDEIAYLDFNNTKNMED